VGIASFLPFWAGATVLVRVFDCGCANSVILACRET